MPGGTRRGALGAAVSPLAAPARILGRGAFAPLRDGTLLFGGPAGRFGRGDSAVGGTCRTPLAPGRAGRRVAERRGRAGGRDAAGPPRRDPRERLDPPPRSGRGIPRRVHGPASGIGFPGGVRDAPLLRGRAVGATPHRPGRAGAVGRNGDPGVRRSRVAPDSSFGGRRGPRLDGVTVRGRGDRGHRGRWRYPRARRRSERLDLDGGGVSRSRRGPGAPRAPHASRPAAVRSAVGRDPRAGRSPHLGVLPRRLPRLLLRRSPPRPLFRLPHPRPGAQPHRGPFGQRAPSLCCGGDRVLPRPDRLQRAVPHDGDALARERVRGVGIAPQLPRQPEGRRVAARTALPEPPRTHRLLPRELGRLAPRGARDAPRTRRPRPLLRGPVPLRPLAEPFARPRGLGHVHRREPLRDGTGVHVAVHGGRRGGGRARLAAAPAPQGHRRDRLRPSALPRARQARRAGRAAGRRLRLAGAADALPKRDHGAHVVPRGAPLHRRGRPHLRTHRRQGRGGLLPAADRPRGRPPPRRPDGPPRGSADLRHPLSVAVVERGRPPFLR